MALQPDALDSIITSTLKHYVKRTFADIVSAYSKFVFFGDLIKSKKQMYDGGYKYVENLLTGMGTNAGPASMYGTYTLSVPDTMKQIEVPERTWRTGWSIDDKVISVNQGNAVQITNEIIRLKTDAELALAHVIERQAIGRVPSTNDTEHMWGLPHWVVWHSGASGSFAGGHPSGFSDVAGLSSTTYAGWNNWDDTYTVVSEDDLLDKLREAYLKTDFECPVKIPESGAGFEYAYYTDTTTFLELMKYSRSQNDNLGLEVGHGPGGPAATFFGVPFRRVPIFDDTAYINSGSNPIYGINWNTMKWICLNGWDMKYYPPARHADQPTVSQNHVFTSANLACNNRRKNFVIAKSDPAV